MMQKKNSTNLGLASTLGFCISSSLSRAFMRNLLIKLDPFSLCFYIFVLGAFFFAFLNIKNYSNLLPNISANLKKITLLNISTTGCWLFLVYPLKYIEPAIVSTITFGMGPLIGIFFNLYFNKKNQWSDYLISLGIGSSVAYIVLAFVLFKENDVPLIQKTISLFCCLTVAISMVVNRFQTRELIDKNFSARDILSLRFILLIVFSGLIAKATNTLEIHHIFNLDVMLVSLLFVIIPLFLTQLSQKYLEPFTISIITPLMPIMTLFFSIRYCQISFSTELLIPILFMLFLIILGTLIKYKKECH